MKKFILAILVCACSHTRPVDAVPPTLSILTDKVDCVNDKNNCLKQAADICVNYNYNGFIITGETSGTIAIDGGTPERGWQLKIQCLNCIETKRTCYTTYR